jgi:hypothetical protein
VFFQRYLIRYTTERLNIFEYHLAAAVREMLSDPVIYPQDGMRACQGCEYGELCRARFSGRPYKDLIEEGYMQNNYYREDE